MVKANVMSSSDEQSCPIRAYTEDAKYMDTVADTGYTQNLQIDRCRC
jgi:hypothetical protein